VEGLLDKLEAQLGSGMYSAFVSYGTPDSAFAHRLNVALLNRGVFTFLFERNAIGGQPIQQTMYDGVNAYDRIVLLCSESALRRKGVLNEIEETFRRESREGGVARLIPIAVDGSIYSCELDERRVIERIRDRVIVSFEGADQDESRFADGVDRLCLALKRAETLPKDGAATTAIRPMPGGD
jgi:hypothetical protein